MGSSERDDLTRLHVIVQRARIALFEQTPLLHRLGEADLKMALLAHLADVAMAAVNALVWALGSVLEEDPT